jgi:hypothetical protein
MKKELVIAWMDKLIEAWYQIRMMRTLSWGGGQEYVSFIGLSDEMEFHLDFGKERDKEEITNMAFYVGAEIVEDDHDDRFTCYSFMYRGFKFFALDGKETE